jgi:hypothetical protein
MPDFDLVATWLCASNTYWETTVQGSSGDEYVVHWGLFPESLQERFCCQHGWQCTCKGFKFRATCRHVKAVEADDPRCAWNAELEPGAECAHDSNDDPCCPECGGRVTAMRVAV